MADPADEKYMRLCFDLAVKGRGSVSPNPLVGAVIVRDGRIVSTGYHERYGGPHAEVNAINSADADLAGATLYCNLEPCVHTFKQTPPCVPPIISSGISKVVIANRDPNPLVRGKGVDRLFNAGLDVEENLLCEEGLELNRFFFRSVTSCRPYITVKFAVSSDGKISAGDNSRRWLTGPESKRYVHEMRAQYDAVLVGANTVNTDNPKLTVRETGGRNPVRVVIDGNLNSNIEADLYNDGESRTILFCSDNAGPEKIKLFSERKIEIVRLPCGSNGFIDPAKILAELYMMKISSLIVEGGGIVLGQFYSEKLFDELIVIEAPVSLNQGIGGIDANGSDDLYLFRDEMLGADRLRIYRNKARGER